MRDFVRNSRGRMFESEFFEFFSKVHPSTPFIFWIPIGLALLGYGLSQGTTTVQSVAAFLPLGWVTWQLLEYFFHKHLFHWMGNGPLTRRFHDIVHGFHHKYPDDDTRLVLPLPVSLLIFGLITLLLWPLGRLDITVPYFVGILFGYLWYDFLHWSTHFQTPRTAWGRRLRAHHMSHHFADHETNFGISHMWLDRVLGTFKKTQPN
jgi:dihydroceramide fatty acyl 2-hydroxylase